jgi:hypothetical protein
MPSAAQHEATIPVEVFVVQFDANGLFHKTIHTARRSVQNVGLSRLLVKFNIRTVHIPRKKTIQILRFVKDDLGLNVPGVYRVPCECGKAHVGQTGRSIETRCKEHRRHIHLDQLDKSAVAEHSINTGHFIDFSNTIVLDGTSSCMDRLVKEAIGIRLTTKTSTGMVVSC